MNKISVWILGDQLLEQHPALEVALKDAQLKEVKVVLIESGERIRQRPYQLKKLVLLLSAMRHYAQELRDRGYEVDYIHAKTFSNGLHRHIDQYKPDKLLTMAAASYQGRGMQGTLQDRLGVCVDILPNIQFLIGHYDPYPEPDPEKRYVMENFYRAMRKHFDVLMEDGDPVGGQWNFDKDNRKRLPKDVKPPSDLSFTPDRITMGVIEEVAELHNHVGSVDNFDYAVTREQAMEAFQHFLDQKLIDFGPYEDAMTARSHSVFHSVLSPYINIGLLEPMELIREVEKAYTKGKAPNNSVEGFIRQVLGWREFMYWQYWRLMPGMMDMNAWQAHRPMPDFCWTGETDMACLAYAIRRALETGYNHHIERLMILSNFFLLTGIEPKVVNEWFLTVYMDAYDWVMPPNVIGMGLNADGGLIATKPYIASANYINRMGDFCKECCYDHRERIGEMACPYNFLYWNFILQHEERLRSNPRTSRSVLGLRHLNAEMRRQVKHEAENFLQDIERFN
jgi:deoxyribodipyrimidine photolyase-related protein